MRSSSRLFVTSALAVVLGLVATGCSSDDAARDDVASTTGAGDTVTPTTPTTTTVDPAVAALAYTEPGPFPVGVATLELEPDHLVEVWYPAAEGTTGEVTYDVREFVAPAIKSLLTADIPASFTIAAGRDAALADGEFPLVLFSHGFAGIRLQSSFLTSHLASWGIIVAAPDHPARDLYHATTFDLGDPATAVDDLRATRELLEAQHDDATSPFAGHVDTTRIAAMGHSAGGATVLGIAPDDGIAGYVSLASGARLGSAPADAAGGATTTTAPALPGTPSLFVAGRGDGVVAWDTVTEAAFDAAPAPSRIWVIDDAGHNAFDDFCTFGNGKGIIGIAEESGLGDFLDSQPQFRSLGSDGCEPPNVPVADTFPIIRHVVTAWFRELFGSDIAAVGLSSDVANEYSVPVQIEEKL